MCWVGNLVIMGSCADCMAYEFQPENVSPFYEDYRAFVKPQVS